MKVFVAGATGAMGKQLVPQLVAAGHEVTGMTSKESNRGLVADMGATPVVADALDPDQVAEAVAVEGAVAQHDPVRPRGSHHRLLQVPDRGQALARVARGLGSSGSSSLFTGPPVRA
jgi:nucleoside-diphosphate-sugar epimerase